MKAWIARHGDGDLSLYFDKPCKSKYGDYWLGQYSRRIDEVNLPDGINPQWSDYEPIEVELTIQMKG